MTDPHAASVTPHTAEPVHKALVAALATAYATGWRDHEAGIASRRAEVSRLLALALRATGWDVVPKDELERLRAVEAAANALPGHHYESGRLDRNGEPGEPICGECDNDWPCPFELLNRALEGADDAR